MGWQDDLNYLNTSFARPQLAVPKPPPSLSPHAISAPAAPITRPVDSWTSIARKMFASPTPGAPPAAPQTDFAGHINVALPTSPYLAPRPPQSQPDPFAPQKQKPGDFFGSIGNAVGDVINPYRDAQGNAHEGLTLGNFIPWFMERTTGLAHELAQSSNPLIAGAGTGLEATTSPFLSGLKLASDVISPALAALPDKWRDVNLLTRAQAFRSAVTGTDLSPFERLLAEVAHMPFGAGAAGGGASYALQQAADLPESVKKAIISNPNGDLNAYLDAAPEGRSWSYIYGPASTIANIGFPLSAYIAETVAGGEFAGLAAGARPLAGGDIVGTGRFGTAGAYGDTGAFGQPALESLQGPGINPALTRLDTPGALGAAARAGAAAVRPLAPLKPLLTMAGKLQLAGVASGMGLTATSVAIDAVAHFAGNGAAVNFFTDMYRYHPVSEDVNVQLLTSFTVNPIHAASLAKQGTLTLAHGLGDITIGKVLGTKLQKVITASDFQDQMIARFYGGIGRTLSKPEVDQIIAQHYDGNRGAVANEILHLALQAVIEQVPKAERIAFAAKYAPGIESTKAATLIYGERAYRLMTKDPRSLAAMFNQRFWQERGYVGAFDPYIAGSNAKIYREELAGNYEMRAAIDAVTGRVDMIPPQGVAGIQSRVGDATVFTLREWNGLIRDYPAIAKYQKGLLEPGATTVSRATLDRVLQKAADDYAYQAKVNPINVSQGHDPVLRPSSASPTRDLAEALGVTEPTAEALGAPTPTSEQATLLRQYLADKGGVDTTGMTDEQAVAQAQALEQRTTEPWRKVGKAVDEGLAKVSALQRQAETLMRYVDDAGHPVKVTDPRNIGRAVDPEMQVEYDRIQRHVGEIRRLIDSARDPITTFAERVEGVRKTDTVVARDTALADAAARKVDAMMKLERLAQNDDELAALMGGGAQGASYAGSVGAEFRKTRNGVWEYAGAAPPMSESMFRRLQRTLFENGKTTAAQGLSEKGDAELWKLAITEYEQRAKFYDALTVAQRRTIDRVGRDATVRRGGNLDNYAQSADLTLEDFTAKLQSTLNDREAILDGQTPYNLRRAAGRKGLPEKAVLDAQDRAQPYWLEYEAQLAQQGSVEAVYTALEHDQPTVIAAHWDALGLDRLADNLGTTRENVLAYRDTFADDIREFIGPRPSSNPALNAETTAIDDAIRTANADNLATLKDQLLQQRATPAEPVLNVPESEGARATAPSAVERQSKVLLRRLTESGGDPHASTSDLILNDPANLLGARVLSAINHGGLDAPPATLRGVSEVLRIIENGVPGRAMGMSPELLAEGERVAKLLLERGIKDARQAGFAAGVITKGVNPAMFYDDLLNLAREHFALSGAYEHSTKGGSPLIVVDPERGGITYGLKKRPADAVIVDLAQVPGLAEEFFTGRFHEWPERVGAARVRQAWNSVFGPLSNRAVMVETKTRFLDRERLAGVSPEDATAIWDNWHTKSKESSLHNKRVRDGLVQYVKGDQRIYGSPRNIPTNELNRMAQEVSGVAIEGNKAPFAGEAGYRTILANTDHATLFREASDVVMRSLGDRGTIGKTLEAMYGRAAYNKFTTTWYYLLRFATDVRFHAQNYVGDYTTALGNGTLGQPATKLGLGMDEASLRGMVEDGVNNTSYAQGHTRFDYAYRAFAKQMLPKDLEAVTAMTADNGALMQQALDEVIRNDPELRSTISLMGDDPAKYLVAMDRWYSKMLDTTVTGGETGAMIREAMAPAMESDPAMAEVYGKIADLNDELWAHAKETFFGNADRSRAERLMNHYLLFWPISYQIRAAKWLFRVLGDSAGGLPTNAGGAFVLDQAVKEHNRLMATDPHYSVWFERHPTLLFMAQMLLPISPDAMGVSLNPGLRAVLFGKAGGLLNIGPVYTATQLIPRALGELYPDLENVPIVNQALTALTGTKPGTQTITVQTTRYDPRTGAKLHQHTVTDPTTGKPVIQWRTDSGFVVTNPSLNSPVDGP